MTVSQDNSDKVHQLTLMQAATQIQPERLDINRSDPA
jgi:hypothetical protein